MHSGLVGLYGATSSAASQGRTLPGLFVEEIGKVQARDASRWRVGGDFGLALYSNAAASCFRGLTP